MSGNAAEIWGLCLSSLHLAPRQFAAALLVAALLSERPVLRGGLIAIGGMFAQASSQYRYYCTRTMGEAGLANFERSSSVLVSL
jgi:hypothetical protein